RVGGGRLLAGLDEVGDRLRVAEAVRVVGRPVLDHHRDPPAELLVDALGDEGVVAQDRVEAAADVQQGHVGLRQLAEQGDGLPAAGCFGATTTQRRCPFTCVLTAFPSSAPALCGLMARSDSSIRKSYRSNPCQLVFSPPNCGASAAAAWAGAPPSVAATAT